MMTWKKVAKKLNESAKFIIHASLACRISLVYTFKQLTRGRQKFIVKTMFKITFCALIVPTKGSNNHPMKDYFKFSI